MHSTLGEYTECDLLTDFIWYHSYWNERLNLELLSSNPLHPSLGLGEQRAFTWVVHLNPHLGSSNDLTAVFTAEVWSTGSGMSLPGFKSYLHHSGYMHMGI
jgi:hypothetical protein